MDNDLPTMKTRLRWKNRKTYSLVIPPAFLQATFDIFPRTNQACIIRSAHTVSGKPALLVEFD